MLGSLKLHFQKNTSLPNRPEPDQLGRIQKGSARLFPATRDGELSSLDRDLVRIDTRGKLLTALIARADRIGDQAQVNKLVSRKNTLNRSRADLMERMRATTGPDSRARRAQPLHLSFFIDQS